MESIRKTNTTFFLAKKNDRRNYFFALEKVGLAHNLGMESGRLLRFARNDSSKKSKTAILIDSCFLFYQQ
jgi:hypothetical protein